MVHLKCGLVGLLVLFLAFSCVLSSLAVPTTRSLKLSSEENPSSQVQDVMSQDVMELSLGEEILDDATEGYIEGRMDLESTDYPGTGANNHHDPRTPGRA
ncbi:hypothetical protein Tsubulata_007652 [Turnera subulata]|uniref:Uncharacterized protein n=1 Tax=Turnera subulata TaxID=218843 RepID=A0A9Q0G0U9_9ROSI|nr:hypothetical protein Tsubulata_007652 [Turnera subulata]